MANEVTVFIPEFEDNLYQAFEPIRMFAKQDTVAPGAKTVNIPGAGALSYANINSALTYPRDGITRADTAQTYDLTNIEIDPIRIGNWEEFSQNANLRQSIFSDVTGLLGQYAIRTIFNGWWNGDGAGGYEYATTGSKTYTNRYGDEVKNLTPADVALIARKLDLQKVPRDNDRYLVLDPEMYAGFVSELAAAGYLEVAATAFQTGMIPMFSGFKIIMLPEVGFATVNNTALQAVNATANANDCNFGFALHKSFVGFAASNVNLFLQESSPEYYGAVISGSFYAGGKYRRANPVGCVTVFEKAV